MPIDFTPERWERVKENARRWWAGELERPLIQIRVTGCDAGRDEPPLPFEPFAAFYGLDTPARDVVDRWDYDLSRQRFLGDAFPHAWPNFGPGAVAAFLGAKLQTGLGTVWFHPREDREIADIHFEYDPENAWLRRVKDLSRAAVERWQGAVQVAQNDGGGNLDILSTFRPGEGLLLDMLYHPDEVKRLTWEAHEMWFRYFDEFNQILQPANPGHTAWTSLFSEEPYYMLQCDFCYMIGPDMFDEFVKPELAAACRRLTNPFYHLDGPGQLPHLDSLLRIEELKGVQWIPGAGQKPMSQWPEVYRKIRDAGKLIQLFVSEEPKGLRMLDTIVKDLGSAKGIALIVDVEASQMQEAVEFLESYGIRAT